MVYEKILKKCNWHKIYRGVKESIPYNAPPGRGEIVLTHCFVDDSLARDLATRRSHTVILIFVKRSPSV